MVDEPISNFVPRVASLPIYLSLSPYTPCIARATSFIRIEALMNKVVFEVIDRYRGSISAEHGIGSLKIDNLPEHKSPVALGLMRGIKQALDPLGLMNPGKMLRA